MLILLKHYTIILMFILFLKYHTLIFMLILEVAPDILDRIFRVWKALRDLKNLFNAASWWDPL